jgi:prevent-host-death family protein
MVNIHEAKTHFSKLIARVQAGEEIVIALAGQPVAKLVPVVQASERRQPGSAAGRIRIAPDFNAPLPDDVVAGFEAR